MRGWKPVQQALIPILTTVDFLNYFLLVYKWLYGIGLLTFSLKVMSN